jgi:hypothetical protein
MNPSLAAALATHGVNNNGSNINQQQSNGMIGAKTSIQALTIHPSLPRVAYLAEDTTSDFGARNKSKPGSLQMTVRTSRLVIQKINRDGDNFGSLASSQGDIIAALSMKDLPQHINRFRQLKSKTSKISNQPFTLATLGALKSITFLDRDALFWNTRRKYGTQSNLDAVNASGVVLDVNAIKNSENGMGQGLCIGLQFTAVVIVLKINDTQSGRNDPCTILSCLEGQRSLSSNGKDYVIQYVPTSEVVPVTNSIIVYGCSDGTMRFHCLDPSMMYTPNPDILSFVSESPSSSPINENTVKSSKIKNRQTTIKSVRGPNGRNDPVVKIVNVDPVYFKNYHHDEDALPAHIGGNAVTVSNGTTLVICSRLLTVCASGVAFFWQVDISLDRASGTLRDLNVLPPLARLDGLGSLTVTPRKSPSPTSRSGVGGFWGGMTTKEPVVAPYINTTPAVSYDPHRDLVVWALPHSAPSPSLDHQRDFKQNSLLPDSPTAKKEVEDGTFIDKWTLNMSLVDALVAKAAPGASSHRPPPVVPPYAMMKLPLILSCASTPFSIVPGLAHAPLPASSLACLCLSKDAKELVVVAAPLPGVAATFGEQRVPPSPKVVVGKGAQWNVAEQPKIIFIESQICHKVTLPRKSEALIIAPVLSASHFAPDSVAVATDYGVDIVKVADGNLWDGSIDMSLMGKRNNLSEPSSSVASAGPIHTVICGGPVGGVANNRPGVLFVENHSVYASRLGSSRSSNEQRQATVEKVDIADSIKLYQLEKSSFITTRETRFSKMIHFPLPLMSPPRLISSPSGRYLCLFWEGKRQYDILHAGSLLVRETGDGRSKGVSPSVNSGSNVVSFAWIGDDDQFAVLRQFEIGRGQIMGVVTRILRLRRVALALNYSNLLK